MLVRQRDRAGADGLADSHHRVWRGWRLYASEHRCLKYLADFGRRHDGESWCGPDYVRWRTEIGMTGAYAAYVPVHRSARTS